MEKNRNLTDASLWDDRWKGRGGRRTWMMSDRGLRTILQKMLDLVPPGGRVLELGAAPGSVIKTMHSIRTDIQYFGIDISEYGVDKSNDLMRHHGVKGRVFLGDMFLVNEYHENQYDLVCSFGLVEHFDPFEPAVLQHFRFARSGGLVGITVPNYATGVVRWLLERCSAETVATHNFSCMDVQALRHAATGGGDVLCAGRFGGPTLPSSKVNETLGGRIYKTLARGWNLVFSAVFLLTPSWFSKFLWEDGIFVLAERKDV